MSVRDEIGAFFDAYADAFARWDAEDVCALWAPTALIVAPQGNAATDAASFRDHVGKLMAFYKGQGVVRPEGALLAVSELYPNVAEARVGYRLLNAAGEEVAAWEHVYMLRRTDRWRILLSVADGEMEAWGDRAAQFGQS